MRVWRTISLLYFGTYTIIILQFLQGIVLTGPVIKRSIRMVREVYPEIEQDKHEGNQAEVCIVGDVVYGADESVPSDQPCLRCKCQPPGVQCEAIQCSQKQGCKAIHKSNQCCPEYQCECIHNGTIYGNGERLTTLPGGECSVCYCRGGEVQCANVSCYKRADCEGRTVPGQCCPKYDHCPLKEPPVDRPIPRIVSSTASALPDKGISTTAIYDVHELVKEDNRITDTFTQPITQAVVDNHIQQSHRDPEPDNIKDIPDIIIQEIIPERKEIPITTAPKQNINVLLPKTQTTTAEALNTSEKETSDLIITDSDTESSEISEIYHQPPPVLKIGDKLLIFKKGELVSGKDISTPVPVITIIGAEGLQRGTEDSSEFHEISSQLQGPSRDIGNFEDFFENDTLTNQETTEKETHIISFVKQKRFTTTSTPEPMTDLPPSLLEFEEVALQESNDNTMTLNKDYLNHNQLSTGIQNTTAMLMENSTTDEVSERSAIYDEVTTDAEDVQNRTQETKLPEVNIHENANESSEIKVYNGNSTVANSSEPSEIMLKIRTSTDTSILSVTDLPENSSLISDAVLPETTNKPSIYFSAHILINPNASLSPNILKLPAISDILDDDFVEVESKSSNESETLLPVHSLDQDIAGEENITVTPKDISVESLEDSGESTTARNNQTMSTENASIETTQNDSHELNTTDMVEILPGFQITTENVENKEETRFEKEAKVIDTQPVFDTKIKSEVTSDDDIFKQLNKELNNTFSALNFTAFRNDEEGAEAMFKELLEEVAASTSAPYLSNQEGSFHPLHEKESQLLQKVSEAISKFQSKESKDALDTRIMGILKEFFSTQHKLDSNKAELVPVLPIADV